MRHPVRLDLNYKTALTRFLSAVSYYGVRRRCFFAAFFPLAAKSGESSKNRICSSVSRGISGVYVASRRATFVTGVRCWGSNNSSTGARARC